MVQHHHFLKEYYNLQLAKGRWQNIKPNAHFTYNRLQFNEFKQVQSKKIANCPLPIANISFETK
jgi:hypothetical protein